MESPITLTFDQGTILLHGSLPDGLLPASLCAWDPRIRCHRAPAVARRAILRCCRQREIELRDETTCARHLALVAQIDFTPHVYQQEAFTAWRQDGLCGTVILPTGAGKTYVGVQAIAHVRRGTLVVAPTLDLMRQWYALLHDTFGVEIGLLGGGSHKIRDITVTTYDSAYLYMAQYGNRFDLLIFDEVHHLPAPNYRQIPVMSTALYRLGLTATYARADGEQHELDYLVGPVVYRRTIDDLAGEYLAGYEIIRLRVQLTEEEQSRYRAAEEAYLGYLREEKLAPYGKGWEQLLIRSVSDPQARAALLARQEMRRLTMGATRKLDLLETLLQQHGREKVLIFTEFTDLVYRISEEFLIPAITHQTAVKERAWILDGFRGGLFNRIVTSRVLNEGVDVPAAKVGIILGGSASSREYAQRLGRLLRKSDGTMAVLYEIITGDTAEIGVSTRRRRYADA